MLQSRHFRLKLKICLTLSLARMHAFLISSRFSFAGFHSRTSSTRLHIWHAILLTLCYSQAAIAGTPADFSPAAPSRIIEPSSAQKAPRGIRRLAHVRATCIGHPDDLRLISVSPYTNKDAFFYLAPAIKSLNLRLGKIAEACRSKGLHACHVFQGAYGSGFLKHNIVGNDLDYMMVVDLGKIVIHGRDTDAAAREIIKKIDAYVEIFYSIADSSQDADLSVMNWGPLGRQGLNKTDGLEEKLTELLDDTVKGKDHRVLLKGRHSCLFPNVLPLGTGYLYANTMVKFVSRQIRYTGRMFAGLREFSVMLHFSFDLALEGPGEKKTSMKKMLFDPTYIPAGRVLPVMDSFLWTVPVGSRSASFFNKALLEDSRALVESRPLRSIGMLDQCEQYFHKKNIMKALKRLHQGFDWIYPLFDNSFRSEISAYLKRQLRNPDVLLCQNIAEMAQMTNALLKDPQLFAMYYGSGDIKGTVSRMSSDALKLEKRYPQLKKANTRLRSAFCEIQEILESNTPPHWKGRASELLNRTERSANEYLIRIMPDSGKILQFKDRIMAKLCDAGFRVLPVRGMSDGTLGVSEQDLSGTITLKTLNSTPGKIAAPAFKYRLINDSEYPCARLILRPGQSEREEENYGKMLDALSKDMRSFVPFQNQ